MLSTPCKAWYVAITHFDLCQIYILLKLQLLTLVRKEMAERLGYYVPVTKVADKIKLGFASKNSDRGKLFETSIKQCKIQFHSYFLSKPDKYLNLVELTRTSRCKY